MNFLSEMQSIEAFKQQLEAEKNRILSDFTENLENSKNRAVVKILEASDNIAKHCIQKQQSKLEPNHKQKLFVLNPSKVQVVNRPEAIDSYGWEATVEFKATRIYNYKDSKAPSGIRTEITSSYMTRHGSTEVEARAALQSAYQEMMDFITI